MNAKSPVSRRALEARIRRTLTKRGQWLTKPRADTAAYRELGAYALVDAKTGEVIEQVSSLEALGKKLQILKAWEALES